MGTPSQTSIRNPGAGRWIALAGCAGALLLTAPATAYADPAQTSDEASQANLQGALLAPLRDVNLMKDEVPQVLNGAQEAPYLHPETASCAQLSQMIAPLEAALGPDRGDGIEVRKTGVGTMVYGAVADVTRDAIPFRGVVRRLTGAARQDQKVREAREAGQLRRAYLKGFASAKGCYGPPQEQVIASVEAPPPVRLSTAPPVQVSTLTPPAPAERTPTVQAVSDPSPRFNLPESWRSQMSTGAY